MTIAPDDPPCKKGRHCLVVCPECAEATLPTGWLQRDMERAAKRVKELKIVKYDPEGKP